MTEQYAVITTYTSPNGRIVVHAYGPYAAKKARQTKNKMVKETDVPKGGVLRINNCKLIDIEML